MLRKDLDDLDESGKKGDWAFIQDDNFIAIRYGDTVFETTVLPISPMNERAWKWDGSREAPTLSPSISVHGGYYSKSWHGFLEKGVLIDA